MCKGTCGTSCRCKAQADHDDRLHNMHRILGVNVNQAFRVTPYLDAADTTYYVDDCGNLMAIGPRGHGEYVPTTRTTCFIINHTDLIVRHREGK